MLSPTHTFDACVGAVATVALLALGGTSPASARTHASASDHSTQPPREDHRETPPREHSTHVDPHLTLAARLVRSGDPAAELFTPALGDASAGTRVLLELDRTTPGLRSALRDRDIRLLRRSDGSIRHLGDVHPAFLPWHALDNLEEIPGLRRVASVVRPGLRRPLDVTTRQIQAVRTRIRPDGGVDGTGERIAMLDAPVDVLHPALFEPDGGTYRWRDVDGDGALTPGVDGVDLDGDGTIDDNERLEVLDGATILDFERGELRNRDGRLQPRRDWLFVDLDGSGRREAGREAGFSEQDPAYGEPLFVAEDVDRDGTLEPREALVRLDSSKIRRLVLDDGCPAERCVFERGDNLIEAAGALRSGRVVHGTAVAGILVGGQAGFHDRIGVAPGAELLVYGYTPDRRERADLHLRALDDARSRGADVFLDEWVNPFTRPLDGSTVLEQAIDRAHDAGLPSIVPVGNLHRSSKVTSRTVEPSDPATLSFQIPDGTDGDDRRAYREVIGSFQWRSDAAATFAWTAPTGASTELALEDRDQTTRTIENVDLHATRRETRRGTEIWTFAMTPNSDAPLPAGAWKVRVEPDASNETPIHLHARVTGDRSRWRGGVRWRSSKSAETSVSFPATADDAVGVGAHPGRLPGSPGGMRPGRLRDYSGRGRRLDGARAVDVTAPDNPFAPLAATAALRQKRGWRRGWYGGFGGTSGAAPHVAGAMALLHAARAETPVKTQLSTLLESAASSGLTPPLEAPPDEAWGWGQLRLFRALHGRAPEESAPPEADLEVHRRGDRVVFDASGSSDPDGDRLQFRFDFTYDRDWETEWSSQSRRTRTLERLDGDGRVARLAVRDRHGLRMGTLVSYDTVDRSGEDVSPTRCGDADCSRGRTPDAGPKPPSPADRGCGGGCATTSPRSPMPRHATFWLVFGVIAGLRLGRCHSRTSDTCAPPWT